MLLHGTICLLLCTDAASLPGSHNHGTGTGAAVPTPAARLALHHLETSVQHFLAAGLADSTARACAVGQWQYLEFCQQTSLAPYPVSKHQSMLFTAFLAGQGLRWQTIKSYLAAVRNLHIRAGVHFPGQDKSLPRLHLMLRGIHRVASQHLPARPRP